MLVVPLATVSGCCEVEYCGTLKVRVAGVKESALAAGDGQRYRNG